VKKTKKFDCVEMMHECGQAVQDEIATMTGPEKAAHFRKRTRALRTRVEAARKERPRAEPEGLDWSKFPVFE